MNNQSLLRNQHANLIVNTPKTRNEMFLLNIQNDVLKCLKSYVNDSSWIWHLRFEYLNFGGLLSIDHFDQLCEGCLLGRPIWNFFPKEATTK